MVMVHGLDPFAATTWPAPLIRQVMVCPEKRARPDIVASGEGCSVKVICPEVTGAPLKSLIVPVTVVVVCARASELDRVSNNSSFFIRFFIRQPFPRAPVVMLALD